MELTSSSSIVLPGLTIGIGVCIYLYFRTKQYLQQYADEVADESRFAAPEEDGNDNEEARPQDYERSDMFDENNRTTLEMDRLSLLDSKLDDVHLLHEESQSEVHPTLQSSSFTPDEGTTDDPHPDGLAGSSPSENLPSRSLASTKP